ncbi:excinuclease ABC subunit A [Candidatus Uhrbacteria bacterium RIFCSPLOWO2_01_FULL_53_9]|uniref:UvrABC system protein A n=3 Tax=Candidatus Uhriibacteriota TaxID=1752732 RepID=A0A1F7UZJ8_9BACT|nr:MAG: excinuclease ABC subunit A [Candidatus Uhrbacteria bacterium RIFCSPHIGHO2_02_FULL_53_13]OGL83218.1 MAG: excinuclease ABC subunit A [Candidatus Uhrbacteria bacterium RIFCSPLOWO2_01_FULL_53_9]
MSSISVRGARVHNLKNINVDIPKGTLTVMTGLSGSGKSSLAFDTIYAEGQRRYMESLSSYARQFLEMQDKPDVDAIEGLSPTIAIDQKTASTNPRSTVGTVTEIYDSLRVLFARAGQAHCPECHVPVVEQTLEQMMTTITALVQQTDVVVLSPMVRQAKGEHKQALVAAEAAGFTSARYDGLLMDLDELVSLRKDKKKAHDLDMVVARYTKGQAVSNEDLTAQIKEALDLGNGCLTLMREDTGEDILMSQALMCPECQRSLPSLQPNMFSFNSPNGACHECTGLGVKLVLEPELVIPNPRLTLAEGAVKPWSRIAGNSTVYLKMLEAVGVVHQFDIHTPIQKFSESKKRLILNGTGGETFTIGGKDMLFSGILGMLEQKYKETDSEYVRKELETYMRKTTCPECDGKRLRLESLAVTVAGHYLCDLVQMPLDELRETFITLSEQSLHAQRELSEIETKVIENVKREVMHRLESLINVGLGYLTLDRAAVSLSGGESQRVRLATQLGTNLSGVIYILDEPSIGLHQRDNNKLIATMKTLRDIGNTVIVVEHDEAMMRAADYVIDVGPGAGVYGGEIIAAGSAEALMACEESLTGKYLKGEMEIPTPKKRRPLKKTKKMTISRATAYNLKNVTVDIPLGQFVCVTGVSGSGKSTLILDILGKALAKHFYRAKAYPSEHKSITGIKNVDKVVTVDQSPIGRTPRSNPATYTGVFTAMRDVFANVPEAQMRGYDAGKFSFNVKGGGRCEVCGGDGQQRIEMQFMPDVYVDCHECHGKRYNAEALEIHYKQKNIADVLDMTVEEARRFFEDTPAIHDKLNVLHEVGLGYIKLGQSATTLSGGEAQRVKLATELSRRSTGKTLYILDEPTSGLHFDDVKRLLEVLDRLVDKGNTVLMVEHNLDVIRHADHVIDMGPEGGARGGYVVAQGTPETVAKCAESLTGLYLKEALKRFPSRVATKAPAVKKTAKTKEAVSV